MTLLELSDRQEIQDLLVDYCYAVDHQQWDYLDKVFAPDAFIDYSELVGFRGNLAETKVFLANALPQLVAYQHSISTSQIRLVGDSAHGRTICTNAVVIMVEGRRQTMFLGLWYRDTFVRTSAGWRIQSRYEERGYEHNAPPGLLPEIGAL